MFSDTSSALLHKKIYNKFWDKLDDETIRKIVQDPNGKESVELNLKVEEEVKKYKKSIA